MLVKTVEFNRDVLVRTVYTPRWWRFNTAETRRGVVKWQSWRNNARSWSVFVLSSPGGADTLKLCFYDRLRRNCDGAVCCTPPCHTAIAGCIRRTVREHHDTGGVGGCSRCYLLCLHRLPQCEPQLRCERLVGRFAGGWLKHTCVARRASQCYWASRLIQKLLQVYVATVGGVSREKCVGFLFRLMLHDYTIAGNRVSSIYRVFQERIVLFCPGGTLNWTLINYRDVYFLYYRRLP